MTVPIYPYWLSPFWIILLFSFITPFLRGGPHPVQPYHRSMNFSVFTPFLFNRQMVPPFLISFIFLFSNCMTSCLLLPFVFCIFYLLKRLRGTPFSGTPPLVWFLFFLALFFSVFFSLVWPYPSIHPHFLFVPLWIGFRFVAFICCFFSIGPLCLFCLPSLSYTCVSSFLRPWFPLFPLAYM